MAGVGGVMLKQIKNINFVQNRGQLLLSTKKGFAATLWVCEVFFS